MVQKVEGVVQDSVGNPIQTTVRAFSWSSGTFLGETTSNSSDGSYYITFDLSVGDVLVTALMGSNIRPLSHGPVTPGDITITEQSKAAATILSGAYNAIVVTDPATTTEKSTASVTILSGSYDGVVVTDPATTTEKSTASVTILSGSYDGVVVTDPATTTEKSTASVTFVGGSYNAV